MVDNLPQIQIIFIYLPFSIVFALALLSNTPIWVEKKQCDDIIAHLGGVFHLTNLSRLVDRYKISKFDVGFVVANEDTPSLILTVMW